MGQFVSPVVIIIIIMIMVIVIAVIVNDIIIIMIIFFIAHSILIIIKISYCHSKDILFILLQSLFLFISIFISFVIIIIIKGIDILNIVIVFSSMNLFQKWILKQWIQTNKCKIVKGN